MVNNPIYSLSPEQLRSPLHFTNLIASSEEGKVVSSLVLRNPQNSPEGFQHPIPLQLPTPRATTFFSTFTSRIERVVHQIVSPSRERSSGTSIEGDVLGISSRVELQDLLNIEEPLENLGFLEGTSIRNLFPTSSPSVPFDSPFSTFDGLHAIGRPIEEGLISPTNCLLLTSTPHIYRNLNNLNLGRDQSESNEGLVILDSLQRERIQSFESVHLLPETQNINQENKIDNEELTANRADVLLPFGTLLPPIVISNNREEDIEREVIVTPPGGIPSGSSSSSYNPPTPPSPPI
jgi:hypothetical protein